MLKDEAQAAKAAALKGVEKVAKLTIDLTTIVLHAD